MDRRATGSALTERIKAAIAAHQRIHDEHQRASATIAAGRQQPPQPPKAQG